jgi:TolB-like protein
MTRRFTLALLLLVASVASASAKPKVAVLGLEVKSTGVIDQTSTSVAHELTEGMRARARKPNGPYSVAANSDKELIDEKLLKNCDDEAVGCMAEIGKELGADFVIYGKVEKEPDQYTITINLLNVKKRQRDNTVAIPVPHTIAPDKLRTMAKKAYNDLVGVVEDTGGSGTLVVRSNAERGKVMLDDEYQGKLAGGTLEIPGVGEGRWRLGIEAAGYKRKEITVVIRRDETTTETLQLVESDAGGETVNLKPIFGVTAGTAIALGLFSLTAWLYFDGPLSQEAAKQVELPNPNDTITTEDCGNKSGRVQNFDQASADGRGPSRAALDDVCRWQTFHKYSGYAALTLGAGAIVLGYFAYRPKGGSASTSASRRHTKIEYSFMPIVTPQGAAASFQLAW